MRNIYTSYLVRDLAPVTGELFEWFPLLRDPASLPSGERQYVVRLGPFRPPAIPDTPALLFYSIIQILLAGPVVIQTTLLYLYTSPKHL